jgi:hypothetical protein
MSTSRAWRVRATTALLVLIVGLGLGALPYAGHLSLRTDDPGSAR